MTNPQLTEEQAEAVEAIIKHCEAYGTPARKFLEAILATQKSDLLDTVEREVIGEDEDSRFEDGSDNSYAESINKESRNDLKVGQRVALSKMRDKL